MKLFVPGKKWCTTEYLYLCRTVYTLIKKILLSRKNHRINLVSQLGGTVDLASGLVNGHLLRSVFWCHPLAWECCLSFGDLDESRFQENKKCWGLVRKI
jgi:hypothetical protein